MQTFVNYFLLIKDGDSQGQSSFFSQGISIFICLFAQDHLTNNNSSNQEQQTAAVAPPHPHPFLHLSLEHLQPFLGLWYLFSLKSFQNSKCKLSAAGKTTPSLVMQGNSQSPAMKQPLSYPTPEIKTKKYSQNISVFVFFFLRKKILKKKMKRNSLYILGQGMRNLFLLSLKIERSKSPFCNLLLLLFCSFLDLDKILELNNHFMRHHK